MVNVDQYVLGDWHAVATTAAAPDGRVIVHGLKRGAFRLYAAFDDGDVEQEFVMSGTEQILDLGTLSLTR